MTSDTVTPPGGGLPWRSAADKLALVQEFASIGVFERDMRTLEARWDAQMFKLFGRPVSATPPSLAEATAQIHPDDREKFWQGHRHVAATGERIALRYRIIWPDGSVHDLHTLAEARMGADGRPLSMIGVIVDDSESASRARQQEAVNASLGRALRLAKVSVWRVDFGTRRIHFNDASHMFSGPTPHADGLDLDELRSWAHPEDRELLQRAAERAMAGDEVVDLESRYRDDRDQYRPLLTRRVADRDDAGRVIGLLGVTFDQTELVRERQRAEQALRDKEAALRASEAKSEFLARASHELRTPLNAVLGLAQLIEHEGPRASPALQLERVAMIRSAGEHLLALVDDVLDLAAIEAGRLSVIAAPVAIDAVLTDAAQWHTTLAERSGVAIRLEPCGGWVVADPRRLRQVVANLLSNAVKFNRPGGSVWLGAQRCPSGWQIIVRDDGRGFEAARQSGIGLGLVIVQQLTALMGGRLEIESHSGRGSELRITLRETLAQPSDPAARLRAPPRPFSVLYIEDNPVNVVLVEGLIALRAGVRLRCAVDGLSGVAMALAEPPDIVLIDMQLPDIDGFEVWRRLRAETALDGSRMIALSANGLTEDIARAMDAGFDDYWTKPIDFKLFLARLDALIAQAAQAA